MVFCVSNDYFFKVIIFYMFYERYCGNVYVYIGISIYVYIYDKF